jgi:hypothetical protein
MCDDNGGVGVVLARTGQTGSTMTDGRIIRRCNTTERILDEASGKWL